MQTTTKRLPEFLVIGAMKCATTTMYQDLSSNPNIFLPEKELNVLANDASTTPAGTQDYANRFRGAKKTQTCGEISTEYTMLPQVQNVAQRAAAVLGQDIKIIYLVRNPVERALSHHMHTFNSHGPEVMGPDINIEARKQSSLLDFGRYAMQLRPWIDQFGLASIKVIRFEDYTINRESMLREIVEFLKITDVASELNEAGANRGTDRAVARGLWYRILTSNLYRNGLRRMVPTNLRDRLRDTLLSTPELRQIPPSPETIDFLIDSLKDDAEELSAILNWPAPIWNFEETRARYASELKVPNEA